MTSTMIPLLYTHIKLRGYAFRCAKFCALLAYPCAECAYPTMAHCWCHNSFGVSVWWMRAILIVYIPIRQCARDLICDLMTHHLTSPRITSHHRVFYCSVETHRAVVKYEVMWGDAGDKICGDARCPVETRSMLRPQIFLFAIILSSNPINFINAHSLH